MAADDYFGELRSIFSTPASAASWESLCSKVDAAMRAQPERATTELIPYLSAQLKSWPAHLRLAPPDWLERALLGATLPELELVSTIVIQLRYVAPGELKTLLLNHKLPDLKQLSLWTVGLRAEQLSELLNAPVATQLEELHLGRNDLSDRGVELLCKHSSKLLALRTLSLPENDIGSRGAWALAQSPLLERLERLNLYANHIGEEGLLSLSTAPINGPLELELRDNAMTPENAKALSGAAFLPAHIRELWAKYDAD